MAKFKGLKATALLGMATLILGASLSSFAAPDTGRARFIVAFKPGTAAAAAARAAITNAGGRVLLDIDEVDAVAVDLPRKAVALLQRSGHVDFIEEDTPRYAFGLVDPSGPPYQLGQLVPYGIKMVQADQLTDTLHVRKLCIVDSGIDGVHEDLNGIPMAGQNLTTSGTWDTDELHHGTHVAGTIAAIDQSNVGVVGINPHKVLNLYIVKVFDASGSAPSSVIAKGMLACNKNKANIVSMSLGGASNALEQKVVTFLAKRNILLIAAAGNAGDTSISYPAGFAEVVSVAAVDINKAHASFSQSNADVELSAPGVSVYSTVPMGTGLSVSLTVGGTPYSVNGMVGSPLASATGPLADFGFGGAIDPAMTGKICLIQRGNSITFSDKVLNCQNSGGLGAVIYNNAPGNFNGTLSGVATAIPSVSASDTDGAAMLGQLGLSATVAVAASNYAFFDGTSMATPHASGAAALVWSYFPTCTAAQIRTSLQLTAQDLGPAGRDDQFGYGLVQAKAAVQRINTMGCGL